MRSRTFRCSPWRTSLRWCSLYGQRLHSRAGDAGIQSRVNCAIISTGVRTPRLIASSTCRIFTRAVRAHQDLRPMSSRRPRGTFAHAFSETHRKSRPNVRATNRKHRFSASADRYSSSWPVTLAPAAATAPKRNLSRTGAHHVVTPPVSLPGVRTLQFRQKNRFFLSVMFRPTWNSIRAVKAVRESNGKSSALPC